MNNSMTISSNTVPAADGPRLGASNPFYAFWQWWLSELRALLPAHVIRWVVGDVAVSDVMVDTSGITLVQMESGKRLLIASVPTAELSTHPVLREMRAKGDDRVRVLLNSDQILLRVITLPAAIEENLREVMGFELDRHTPFVASQAYYDVKLRSRDPQRETIDVLLAVAARAVVDPLLATVRQAGLSIDAITVADIDAAEAAIELLPAIDKPARKWGNLLKLNLALLALALLLGLLALLLPIWQKRTQVIALTPLVSKANAEFEISQRQFDEYTKLAGEYNYITGKKQGMYPSLAILEELTKIFVDTTSVQIFDLKSNGKIREVTLRGEALAASRVIEALEQSPLFQNASQRSQTQRGSQGTNEHFHIATELKPKPLPAATLLREKANEVIATPAPPFPGAIAAPMINSPSTMLDGAVKSVPGAPPAPGQSAKTETPTATVTVIPPANKALPIEPAPRMPPADRKQP